MDDRWMGECVGGQIVFILQRIIVKTWIGKDFGVLNSVENTKIIKTLKVELSAFCNIRQTVTSLWQPRTECHDFNLIPLRFTCTWSPSGITVWGNCATFRRWSLIGGSRSTGSWLCYYLRLSSLLHMLSQLPVPLICEQVATTLSATTVINCLVFFTVMYLLNSLTPWAKANFKLLLVKYLVTRQIMNVFLY